MTPEQADPPQEDGSQNEDQQQQDQPEQQPQQDPAETAKFRELRRESAKYRAEARDANKRIADLEDRDKTESQKAADKIARLEQEIPQAVNAAFKRAAVALGQVSQEDADLFLVGSDEDTLYRQLERLGTRSADQNRKLIVRDEGGNPKPKESDELTAVRELFGNT